MNNFQRSGFIILMIIVAIESLTLMNLKTSLDTTRSALVETENRLVTTTTELDNTRAQLTEKESQLNLTNSQLASTKIELSNVNTQLRISNEKNSQMLSQYASLREKINDRTGDTKQARQSYITPSDITVSNKVQEITNGYSGDTDKLWRDYEKLYHWVVNNISYSYDSYTPMLPESLSGNVSWQKDFWRMPTETLADKTGDCEDMALLLASMMKNYNQGKFSIWLITIASNVPSVPGHVTRPQ